MTITIDPINTMKAKTRTTKILNIIKQLFNYVFINKKK